MVEKKKRYISRKPTQIQEIDQIIFAEKIEMVAESEPTPDNRIDIISESFKETETNIIANAPSREISSHSGPIPKKHPSMMGDIAEKWKDPAYGEDLEFGPEWKRDIHAKVREGDVHGIIKSTAPVAEMVALSTMLESTDEALRFKAATFILGQGGYGEVKKVEQTNSYEVMPTDQLLAMIRSKMSNIQKLDPTFDITRAIPAEFTTVSDSDSKEDSEVPSE